MAGPALGAEEVRILVDANVLHRTTAHFPGKGTAKCGVIEPPDPLFAGIRLSRARDPHATLEIPLALESPEGFEFLGFSTEIAPKLYHDFQHRSEAAHHHSFKHDIIGWVHAYIERLDSPALSALPPEDALNRIGADSRLSARVLKRYDSTWRCADTLIHWTKQAIDERYYKLEVYHLRLKEKARRISQYKNQTDSTTDLAVRLRQPSVPTTDLRSSGASSAGGKR